VNAECDCRCGVLRKLHNEELFTCNLHQIFSGDQIKLGEVEVHVEVINAEMPTNFSWKT